MVLCTISCPFDLVVVGVGSIVTSVEVVPIFISGTLDVTIRIFTSFAFADLQCLGFDSTVSRIEIDEQVQYRYQIGESFTLPEELWLIIDHGSNFIRGRGTRVFEAYLESDPDVALKDMWLEDDRTEESVPFRG